jgi:hypothetical protein
MLEAGKSCRSRCVLPESIPLLHALGLLASSDFQSPRGSTMKMLAFSLTVTFTAAVRAAPTALPPSVSGGQFSGNCGTCYQAVRTDATTCRG